MPQHTQRLFDFNAVSITNAGLETVGEVKLGGDYDECVAELTVATQNLANFAVQVKAHDKAAYHTLISGADWDLETISIKPYVSNGELDTLTAGTTATFRLEVGAFHSIKFQAQAAAGTAAVTLRGVLRRKATH